MYLVALSVTYLLKDMLPVEHVSFRFFSLKHLLLKESSWIFLGLSFTKSESLEVSRSYFPAILLLNNRKIHAIEAKTFNFSFDR
jgi:hypothetical protein